MKKLKIGIITHNFPSSESDRQNAGIFVYDLAKELNKKAEVLVFSPGPSDIVKKISSIKTYFFKFEKKLGSLKVSNPKDLLSFANFFFKGNQSFVSFLDKNRDLDFIISMWAFPSGFFAYKALRKYGIPYSIYCLGSDIYIYSKKPILKNEITKYLKSAKFLTADSPDLANETKELSGKETIFLPSSSALNIEKSSAKKNSKTVFTFLGRLEKVKGIDILIETFTELKNEKYQLNIIGDGSLTKWIKQQTGNNPNIRILGNISNHKKISSILNNSDWLIIPSRSDSIPLVFSESMKHNLPVITSDLPDLKYLVNKFKIGYVFEKENTQSLKKIIEATLAGRSNHKEFKKNTKKAAEIFDLKKTSDKLINLVKQNEKRTN